MNPFKRILIASDLEDGSRAAITRGLALAVGGHAIVVHVLSRHIEESHWRATLFDTDLARYRELLAEELSAARSRLSAQITDVAGRSVEVDLIVRAGHPASVLVEVAREMGADLIVVGTHGRRGTISSVAERVVRESECPVLVVPTPLPTLAAQRIA